MNCTICNNEARRFGKDRKGNQRFQCLTCKKTFSEPHAKPLGNMILAEDKALSVIHHLVEGCSIRTTERITGVEKKTIISLLSVIGPKCEALLNERVQNIRPTAIQADEIWGYVNMKEKTKARLKKEDDDHLGDAYCFIAIESTNKLIVAWHLGRRTIEDTVAFTEKIDRATTGHGFDVYTDGFRPYQDAVVYSLGAKHVNFAQIIKVFGISDGDDHKYSPPTVIGLEKNVIFGDPDLKRATTSHIERQNLTVRMSMRRMTRLTNGFSKKWENLKNAYALYFAYYNFCRVHQTLRVTPAMEAGITNHVWTIKELVI